MQPGNLIIFLIFVTVIASFIIGAYMDPVADCEDKECKCFTGGRSSEINCKSCTIWNPIFVSGVVNYGKTCQAREIYLCDEDKFLGTRYDIFAESCERGMKVLSVSPDVPEEPSEG